MSAIGDAVGALANAGSDIITVITGGGSGSSAPVSTRAAGEVVGWLGRAILAIAQMCQQEYGAVTYSATLAKQIAQDLVDAEKDTEACLDHLQNVVLPHALSYLAGDIYQTDIFPLKQSLSKLSKTVATLTKEVSTLDAWRASKVDPDLALLINFRTTWIKQYQAANNTLLSWLRNPANLANFLVSAMSTALYDYWSQPAHAAELKRVALLLVNAWATEPENIEDSIERWLVAPAA
jgi:hypothetical protein